MSRSPIRRHALNLALALLHAGWAATPCQAGPLSDWLFGRQQPAPAAAPAPAPTIAFCYPTNINLGGCNTCQSRTVVNYAPQTYYHTTWLRVPVTQYKPISGQDPVTCCRVTYMQPCTTYVWQARRVPQTVYRPFLSRVTYANPCCNTAYAPGGLTANSIIVASDQAGAMFAGGPQMAYPGYGAAPNNYVPNQFAGAPIAIVGPAAGPAFGQAGNGQPNNGQPNNGQPNNGQPDYAASPYAQPATGQEGPATYGGGFFQGPGAGGAGGATTVPANSQNGYPAGQPAWPLQGDATTAPAGGSVEPADQRPSLQTAPGDYRPDASDSRRMPPSWSPNPSGPAPAASTPSLNPSYLPTPPKSWDAAQNPPAVNAASPWGNPAPAASSALGSNQFGSNQTGSSPRSGTTGSSSNLSPIVDPDAGKNAAGNAGKSDAWPEAPQLFDPRDRSAQQRRYWGSVPAAWPATRRGDAEVAGHSAPTSENSLRASTYSPPVSPPRLVGGQAADLSAPAPGIDDAKSFGSAAIQQPARTVVAGKPPRLNIVSSGTSTAGAATHSAAPAVGGAGWRTVGDQ